MEMIAERRAARSLTIFILSLFVGLGWQAAGSTYYEVRVAISTTSEWVELSVEGAEFVVDWWAPANRVNGLHVHTSPVIRMEKPCCMQTPATVEFDLLIYPSDTEEISWTVSMGTYGRCDLTVFAMPDGNADPIRLARATLIVRDDDEEGPSRTVRTDVEEITTQAKVGESPDASSSTYAEGEDLPDIEYATLPNVEPRFLSLDLMLPARDRSNPPPLIVFIHGGGMFGGDKQELEVYFNDVGNIVGTRYAVASVNYRLMPEHTFPAQLDDVRGAIQWLRAHADEYGYDGSRIGLWGFSAGGCLGLLAGLTEGVDELAGSVGDYPEVSTEISAICSYSGTIDFRTMFDGVPWGYLGCEEGDMDYAAFASPISYATSDDPPTFLLHGTSDQYLPFEQTVTLFELLQEAGVNSELVLVEGAMHGGPTGWTGEGPRAVRDFLDRYLLGED